MATVRACCVLLFGVVLLTPASSSLGAPPSTPATGSPPGVLSDLDEARATEVARQLAELGPACAGDEIVGRIEIPRVGVSADILEGVDDATIRRGVGHFPETPWPGGGGNVALAAHRTTDFRGLREIREGDRITVTHAGVGTVYEVVSTFVVEPRAVWVLDPSDAPTLTLVTCFPFDFRGHAPKRFIVRARAVAPGSPLRVDTTALATAE